MAVDYDRTPRPERTEWRLALAENIRQNGLVNPLIVLNHPRRKCPPMRLMVGTNRLWALRYLGRTVAPAIVTGECAFPCQEVPDWNALRSLFKDGEPYLSAYGIALTNTKDPSKMEYPTWR